jgi:hypothetical protein
MAKDWKRFLEEESEHQWLAISLFFVFIIIGAFAIHGTSKLTGMDIENNTAMENSRTLEIIYQNDGSHYAVSHTTDGTYFYHYDDGIRNDIIDPLTDSSASSIRFITELNNDTIATSVEQNSIMIVDGSSTTNFNLSDSRGVFGIIGLSQNLDDDSNSMIMITDEGDHTSFRGVSDDGVPSSSMPNNVDVEWQKVEALNDNEWIATGVLISSNSNQNFNPASPEIKPVIGHIIWTGGFTAPMLDKMYTAPSGEFHSMIRMGDQMIIAGTSQTTIFDANDLSFEHSSITSKSAMKSDCNVVWFFGSLNSDSVIKWTKEGHEVIEMQHSMPIEIETQGSTSDMIYMHGSDSNGEYKVLTFDSSSYGSIESGRGFLNFSFILIFSIIFAVMGWNIIERMKL